jgi:hypothetical protein
VIVNQLTPQTEKSVLSFSSPLRFRISDRTDRLTANGADERPSERRVMSNQSIASVARKLAAALLAATWKDNANDEPQKEISALERELIEEFQAEIVEVLRM